MAFNEYKYDKDELKENLTIEQIFELVAHLGGEPQLFGNYLVSRTICHNNAGEGSRKLYYYDNTKLFRCYTDCGDTFDIYELVLRAKSIQDPKFRRTSEGEEYYGDWNLPESIEYTASYFGISAIEHEENNEKLLVDWKILTNYERIADISQEKQIVELKIYDDKVLKNLPKPRIEPWLKEGISQEVMNLHNIAYNPKSCGIVIPHYNIDGELIGIRERTLIKSEESKGKYKPSILNGQMYNHPLSFNLYNLNNSKENIQKFQKLLFLRAKNLQCYMLLTLVLRMIFLLLVAAVP